MKKKKERGLAWDALDAMTVSQRRDTRRELEKERVGILKDIETLLTDVSRRSAGGSLRMKRPKKLGSRPNDVLED